MVSGSWGCWRQVLPVKTKEKMTLSTSALSLFFITMFPAPLSSGLFVLFCPRRILNSTISWSLQLGLSQPSHPFAHIRGNSLSLLSYLSFTRSFSLTHCGTLVVWAILLHLCDADGIITPQLHQTSNSSSLLPVLRMLLYRHVREASQAWWFHKIGMRASPTILFCRWSLISVLMLEVVPLQSCLVDYKVSSISHQLLCLSSWSANSSLDYGLSPSLVVPEWKHSSPGWPEVLLPQNAPATSFNEIGIREFFLYNEGIMCLMKWKYIAWAHSKTLLSWKILLT